MPTVATLKYDTGIEYINGPKGPEPRQPNPSPHRSLIAIANLLGRQAAAHVHRYRFEGLGRIELIRLQEEAKRDSADSSFIEA